jgi:hypothetical protein
MQSAIDLIDPIADLLRKFAPGTFLAGLRFNLAGDRLIVSLLGPAPSELQSLTSEISDLARTDVMFEQQKTEGFRGLLGGGVGKISGKRPETFQDLLDERVEALATPGTFAPQGIPRLGSMVRTPDGVGMLTRVDIRRGKGGVQLSNGNTVDVQLDRDFRVVGEESDGAGGDENENDGEDE